MASALINTTPSTEALPPTKHPPFSHLHHHPPCDRDIDLSRLSISDDLVSETDDFEFRLDDPVEMLSADELFCEGKLLPLHLTNIESRYPDDVKPRRELEKPIACESVSAVLSPKAPRCSGNWREILRLRKSKKNQNNVEYTRPGMRSLKQFLNKNSKSYGLISSMKLPLLKDLDSDTSPSSSSTSSEDLITVPLNTNNQPSLTNQNRNDSENHDNDGKIQNPNPSNMPSNFIPNPGKNNVPGRARNTQKGNKNSIPGIPGDNPRMNCSRKVVFHGLGRSTSSPGSFNSRSRLNHRGIKKSYSANTAISPVLNMPVCSLTSMPVPGFGYLFSLRKKEAGNRGTRK